MTQYQPPYTPPNPPYPANFDYYTPQVDALAPARKAAGLMYVLGGLVIAGGLCCAGIGSVFPRMMQERPELFQQFSNTPGFKPDMFQTVFLVLGVVVVILGIGMIVLGRFIRSGGIGAVATGIVLTSLALLYLLANLAITSISLRAATGPELAGAACVSIVPLSLFALLLVWLIQAAKMSGHVRAMQQQYAMQYWQHQQQQRAYGQGGYPTPPPPPPRTGGPDVPPPQV